MKNKVAVIKSVILLVVVSATLLSATTVSAQEAPTTPVNPDNPAEQQNADRSAYTANRSITNALAECSSTDYGCKLLKCDDFGTLQYEDACYKVAYDLHSCQTLNLLNDAGILSAYMPCLNGMRATCDDLPPIAPQRGDKTPENTCRRAALWYISPYSNPDNPKYNQPDGITHLEAYQVFGPVYDDTLTNDEFKALITALRDNPSVTPQEPVDGEPGEGDGGDEDGGDDTEGSEIEILCDSDAQEGGDNSGFIDNEREEECVRREFADASRVPDNLKCRNGGSGIQISTPIGESECIDVGSDEDLDQNVILATLRTVLRVITGGVGLVVAGMIVVAGIQYMTSQGNPQATAAAKQRLTNAIIGLVMFIFSVSILNFLIPGGLIGG